MGDGGHWVTQYSLNYSCDGVKWFQHRFQGADVVSYDVQYLQSSLIGLGGGGGMEGGQLTIFCEVFLALLFTLITSTYLW